VAADLAAGGNIDGIRAIDAQSVKVSRMCTIEGCETETVAKGLCWKHYMRWRRTGDPAKARKPGRKRDPVLMAYRGILGDWSPRTLGRYALAMRLLPDEEARLAVIQRATRSNGSLNVSRMLDLAAMEFVKRYRA
jgi:hypothetical protein